MADYTRTYSLTFSTTRPGGTGTANVTVTSNGDGGQNGTPALTISGTYDGLTIQGLNTGHPNLVGTGSGYYDGIESDGLYFNLPSSNSEVANIYSRSGGILSVIDSYNSTDATVNSYTVCFCSGTLIRTTHGDVAVEDLAVGNVAVTASGAHRPIRWIGHRDTVCDRHPEPRKVWPVRVVAGTFGEGLPYADLWLSPGHALCLENGLVPVRGLIDGDRIVQVQQDAVTYWHVELDSHDVLLANGLPAESYLDTGNRRGFDNAEVTTLHFDEDSAPGYDGSGYCLPVIESGPRLSAIRAQFGLCASPNAVTAPVSPGVHLVADGAVIAARAVSASELRFVVPAGTAELRLVSPAFPASGDDVRRLGVVISALAVSDGAGWRDIALHDDGLYAGFHEVERNDTGAWRWTDGEGHLSPCLWAELNGDLLLRVRGTFTGLAHAEAAACARESFAA